MEYTVFIDSCANVILIGGSFAIEYNLDLWLSSLNLWSSALRLSPDMLSASPLSPDIFSYPFKCKFCDLAEILTYLKNLFCSRSACNTRIYGRELCVISLVFEPLQAECDRKWYFSSMRCTSVGSPPHLIGCQFWSYLQSFLIFLRCHSVSMNL